MKIQQKAALENVRGVLMYQAIAEVAMDAFGEKKDTKERRPPSPADVPNDAEEAARRFKALMG